MAREDLALLRQVLSERPFLKERGKTMAAWGELAAQLVGDDNSLRGENAQARFDKLVQQEQE
ncbi:hypothetical protein GQ600_2298 [Phytophthora cactorum]|nr:hypothetical protein GQ600_2298 [Phytophthora cactorum]